MQPKNEQPILFNTPAVSNHGSELPDEMAKSMDCSVSCTDLNHHGGRLPNNCVEYQVSITDLSW
jgi:hypothetical protein